MIFSNILVFSSLLLFLRFSRCFRCFLASIDIHDIRIYHDFLTFFWELAIVVHYSDQWAPSATFCPSWLKPLDTPLFLTVAYTTQSKMSDKSKQLTIFRGHLKLEKC